MKYQKYMFFQKQYSSKHNRADSPWNKLHTVTLYWFFSSSCCSNCTIAVKKGGDRVFRYLCTIVCSHHWRPETSQPKIVMHIHWYIRHFATGNDIRTPYLPLDVGDGIDWNKTWCFRTPFSNQCVVSLNLFTLIAASTTVSTLADFEALRRVLHRRLVHCEQSRLHRDHARPKSFIPSVV